jgi:hypothetical protein
MWQPARRWCSRRAVLTGLVLAAWSSSGCMHWKTQSAFPEVVAGKHPSRVRVTRGDGSRVVLLRPEVLGDSLVGAPAGRSRSGGRPAVALADVSEVALRRVDPAATAAMGLGTLALAGVVVIGLLWSSRAD